jgi:hypothetical protein
MALADRHIMRYSLITAGEARRNHRQTMTHTLTEGCQTFSFTPNQFGVAVLRKALNGRTNRWQVTGNFQMTKAEARSLWKHLVTGGATRI